MVKRVDLAVYRTVKDLSANAFSARDLRMGLDEGGVSMAEVTLDFPGKAEALQKVDALKGRGAERAQSAPPTSLMKASRSVLSRTGCSCWTQ